MSNYPGGYRPPYSYYYHTYYPPYSYYFPPEVPLEGTAATEISQTHNSTQDREQLELLGERSGEIYKSIADRDENLAQTLRTKLIKLEELVDNSRDKKRIYKAIGFLIRKHEDGYTCIVCERMYRGAQSIRLHITKNHLKLKLYPCPDPNCAYATAYNDISRHIANHHPELTPKNK